MIEFINVKKSFGEQTILRNMTFNIEDKSIVAFVGKNGCGKTTTLKLMLGLLRPDEGQISYNKIPISTNHKKIKETLAYVSDAFETNTSYNLWEYLLFYAECYGIKKDQREKQVDNVLRKLFIEKRKYDMVDTFSKGTKAIVSLARVLVCNPDIIVLDEAMDGLDNFSKAEFKNILCDLRDSGKTIVLTSHQLSEVKDFCTHIGLIEHNTMNIYGETNAVLSSKIFQKRIVIELESNIEEAMKFIAKNVFATDITMRFNKLYVGFNGSKEEEVKLLKELIHNDFNVRTFEYIYEHNYDY